MIKVVEVKTCYINISEHFICHSKDDIEQLAYTDEVAEKFDGYSGTDWDEIEDYEERIEAIMEEMSTVITDANLEDIYSLDILPGSLLETMNAKEMERHLKLANILEK